MLFQQLRRTQKAFAATLTQNASATSQAFQPPHRWARHVKGLLGEQLRTPGKIMHKSEHHSPSLWFHYFDIFGMLLFLKLKALLESRISQTVIKTLRYEMEMDLPHLTTVN